MFTIHKADAESATFHYDAEGETPRRFHCVEFSNTGKFHFVTDMCGTGDRKPGIPERLRDVGMFDSISEAAFEVLLLNTIAVEEITIIEDH